MIGTLVLGLFYLLVIALGWKTLTEFFALLWNFVRSDKKNNKNLKESK